MAGAVCWVSPDKLMCQCNGAPPLTRAPAICKDFELFLCVVAPLLNTMQKVRRRRGAGGKKSEISEGSGKKRKRIWSRRRELQLTEEEKKIKYGDRNRVKGRQTRKMEVGASLCQCLPSGKALASLWRKTERLQCQNWDYHSQGHRVPGHAGFERVCTSVCVWSWVNVCLLVDNLKHFL